MASGQSCGGIEVNGWFFVGAICLALGLGGAGELHGRYEQRLADRHAIDQKQIEAAALRDQLRTAAHEKEISDAKYALDLEMAGKKSAADVAAAADAARPRINDLVRQIAACRRGSSGNVPSGPAHPTGVAGSAAGSAGGLPDGIGERFTRLGESANKLAAWARTECVPWAARVGR